MAIAKNSFWDHKILPWEEKRYFRKTLPIEIEPSKFKGNSLQYRIYASARILKPLIKDKAVLDIGCGSGGFLSYLEPAEPKKLIGIDFSKNAIESAQKRFPNGLYNFNVGNVVETAFPEADYVTGLGLLDWLSEEEITVLFSKLKGRRFLFSFSERRRPILRALHYVFVMLTYGWKTSGYIPAYHTAAQIEQLILKGQGLKNGQQNLFFFRHSKLSFSTLVANFPLDLK